MKTGIYWQDPKYAVGGRHTDPSCVLSLPLHRLDGVSFMSKDAYGHLCTVTGALWTPRGRRLDGVDDYIKAPDTSLPDGASARTFSVWVKAAETSQESARVLVYGTESEPFGRAFGIWIDSNDEWSFMGYGVDLSSDVAIDTSWHFITITYTGITVYIYVDASEENSGDKSLDTVKSGYLWLGIRPALTGDFKGDIGEVWVYNRALTPLEIQHHYLAAKWRYR